MLTVLLLRMVVLLLLFAAIPAPTMAGGGQSQPGQGGVGVNDSNKTTLWDIRKNYFMRYPAAAEFGPEKHDRVDSQTSQGPGHIKHNKSGPVQLWPTTIQQSESTVPTLRDEGIMDDLFQTFGYPVSDTQFQIIQRYNDNRMVEQLFDPEKLMWVTNSVGGMQANSAANSSANMARSQAGSAIDEVSRGVTNFTADPSFSG